VRITVVLEVGVIEPQSEDDIFRDSVMRAAFEKKNSADPSDIIYQFVMC